MNLPFVPVTYPIVDAMTQIVEKATSECRTWALLPIALRHVSKHQCITWLYHNVHMKVTNRRQWSPGLPVMPPLWPVSGAWYIVEEWTTKQPSTYRLACPSPYCFRRRHPGGRHLRRQTQVAQLAQHRGDWTLQSVEHRDMSDMKEQKTSHPAKASLSVKVSFSNMAPAIEVVKGARNVRTVASDSERYCRL